MDEPKAPVEIEAEVQYVIERELDRRVSMPPPPSPEKVDGMPGTWSHCCNSKNHAAHRHTIIFMEGPYYNILCKGTPGAIDGDAPFGRIVYE